MQDLRLSDHFTLSEFTRSATADKYGFKNTPNENQIANLKALCENVLEPLRTFANSISPHPKGESVGVFISSGFRCPKLNALVGGVPNSQHKTGEAADIRIPDIATGNLWFEWMEDNLQFDQLIKERATRTSKSFWIHVSYKLDSSKNRQQVKSIIKNK